MTRTVVKRKSLFDDRPDEIQQLTYIVKQHIDALNAGIGTARGREDPCCGGRSVPDRRPLLRPLVASPPQRTCSSRRPPCAPAPAPTSRRRTMPTMSSSPCVASSPQPRTLSRTSWKCARRYDPRSQSKQQHMFATGSPVPRSGLVGLHFPRTWPHSGLGASSTPRPWATTRPWHQVRAPSRNRISRTTAPTYVAHSLRRFFALAEPGAGPSSALYRRAVPDRAGASSAPAGGRDEGGHVAIGVDLASLEGGMQMQAVASSEVRRAQPCTAPATTRVNLAM